MNDFKKDIKRDLKRDFKWDLHKDYNSGPPSIASNVGEILVLRVGIVKLRSRSRSGEGQVRVRKVKELDLSYTLFSVFTLHSHKLFS